MMSNTIPSSISNIKSKQGIKLGEILFSENPENFDLLGIGTCVAVFLYDLKKGYYSMAHTVLPKKEEFISKNNKDSRKNGKYVDTGIVYMLSNMLKKGCRKSDIKAKLVGGAQIFENAIRIGDRNIISAHEILKENKIPINGEDIGGKKGRSVISFNSDGTVLVRKRKEYFTI